jgi:hypothetical protein
VDNASTNAIQLNPVHFCRKKIRTVIQKNSGFASQAKFPPKTANQPVVNMSPPENLEAPPNTSPFRGKELSQKKSAVRANAFENGALLGSMPSSVSGVFFESTMFPF